MPRMLSQDDECEGMDSRGERSRRRCVLPGRRGASADAGEAPRRRLAADAAGLTSREREVLELLANGCAMKVIAYRLGITYRTVAFHKYKMMQRLGIRTNAGLTTYALQTGALKSAPLARRISAADPACEAGLKARRRRARVPGRIGAERPRARMPTRQLADVKRPHRRDQCIRAESGRLRPRFVVRIGA